MAQQANMQVDIASIEQLDMFVKDHEKVVVHFWAQWCEPCAFMDQVLRTVQAEEPSVAVARVEAEELPHICERHAVTVVPHFLFFRGGKVVDTLEGASIPQLSSKAFALAGRTGASLAVAPGRGSVKPASAKGGAKGMSPGDFDRLAELVRSQPVMLFMKGTPEAPQCGFSRKVATALSSQHVPFGSFDILSDQAVRQGLKEYSNWPTYPQLYVKGELLGGCDIVMEMAQDGTLKETIDEMLA